METSHKDRVQSRMMGQKFCVLSVVWALLNLSSTQIATSGAAEGKAAWKVEWEKTVDAAKREGQVLIYAAVGPYHADIFTQFQKDYPEIKVVITHGYSSRMSPRLLAERRAGKYLADVYLGGPDSLYSFYNNKLLEPIAPLFILPEVLDQSKWWENRHFYIDPENKYIFVNEGSITAGLSVGFNTNLVKVEEFKSYWDLMRPKWKGKIVSLDARDPSFGAVTLRFLYYHPELGPEFIRRLFSEMDITISKDPTQVIDWVAAGKFAICVFCREDLLNKAKGQGVSLEAVDPNELKEMPRLRGSASNLVFMNKAPHPNVARVFVNWFLSRRGQIVYQESHGDRDSLRIDIPKDKVPPASRRLAGKKYFFTESPQFMDAKAALSVMENALASRGKVP